MIPLSSEVRSRLEALFPPEQHEIVAKTLLERCGDGLPLTDLAGDQFWDRIRFAVLKLSGGDMAALQQAVDGANRDWRDTLVAAGFGDSLSIHTGWFPNRGNKA
jgi:hypothetical protein